MRTSTLRAALIGVGVAAAGCIFDPDTEDPPRPLNVYSENLSHPDSLLKDLQVAYRRREVGPYARLLGREFIFHFLPADAGEIPDGEWNRDEDSTGTYGLFSDAAVSNITIALDTEAPRPMVLRGEEVLLVTVRFTDLKVDVDGGNTTLQVNGDQQLFYFQLGEEADGEEPGRYYFVDWEDLGGGRSKPGTARMRDLKADIARGGTVPVCLSELRALFAKDRGPDPSRDSGRARSLGAASGGGCVVGGVRRGAGPGRQHSVHVLWRTVP